MPAKILSERYEAAVSLVVKETILNCLGRDGGREIETEDEGRLLYAAQSMTFRNMAVSFS